MENEIKIMNGLAKIKRCKSSNIWQFSMWIKKEKNYYRQPLAHEIKNKQLSFHKLKLQN
jgi:hypothetical protein